MRMPLQSSPVGHAASSSRTGGGVGASFCTPCVAGRRICGLPFRPRVRRCSGGAVCRNVGPCLPFVNRRLRCCVPGGCRLVRC